MKILITGASGYLATSIAILLQKKHNLSLLTRKASKISNIKKNKIKIIRIKNYDQILSLKIHDSYDCILHCVGMNKISSNMNFKKAQKLKLNSTKNILNFALKNKIKKFIYISSMQVYRNYNIKKIINEKSQLENKTAYASAHLSAEKIITKYKNKIDYTILRPSSVFGYYYQSSSRELIRTILNNFCYQAKVKKIIKIQKPNWVSNFLPISILAKCIDDIISKKIIAKDKIINIGYFSNSLLEIAKIISLRFKKLFNLDIQIKFKENMQPKYIKFQYKSKKINYLFNYKIFIKEIDRVIYNIKQK